VPYRYARKHSTSTAERFITEELKELEKKIVGADDEILALEQVLYEQLLVKIDPYLEKSVQNAQILAHIDVLLSFSLAATKYGYVRPEVDDTSLDIIIKDGRHPIAEKLLGQTNFVPNDTALSKTEHTMIVTGPNMSGKSVYMRQVALIVLMAQCGSFVPASFCKMGVVDKIFTRVGAGDDLLSGQSTFMVEMSEVAEIANNVTDRSLLLLDEIGRGTATYDGLSIAWAVVEFFTQKTTARTIFSTHYHELTHLQDVLKGCTNYKMNIKEVGDHIVFLRKLQKGSIQKSFGIEVAKLSGLPQDIIARAKSILQNLEKTDITKERLTNTHQTVQMDMFAGNQHANSLVEKLKSISLDDLTPRESFDLLCTLQDLAQKI